MKILIAVLALSAIAAILPQPAHAGQVTPPPVPPNIQVPAGNEPFLVGHAVGTQDYICLPAGSGVAFKLFTPQATLFKDNDKQISTHFFSPNPDENGTIRPTWQDSLDTSAVWGEVKPGNASSDANYVQPGAIPWLLVTVVGAQNGTMGRDLMVGTTYIQRLNTSGGVAPTTGCSSPANIGVQAFVPYAADYFFFRRSE